MTCLNLHLILTPYRLLLSAAGIAPPVAVPAGSNATHATTPAAAAAAAAWQCQRLGLTTG
jgi:hypothetical protein